MWITKVKVKCKTIKFLRNIENLNLGLGKTYFNLK